MSGAVRALCFFASSLKRGDPQGLRGFKRFIMSFSVHSVSLGKRAREQKDKEKGPCPFSEHGPSTGGKSGICLSWCLRPDVLKRLGLQVLASLTQ